MCAHIVALAYKRFELIREGQLAIDPSIDVYSSEELRLSRDQIQKRMPHHLPLIKHLFVAESKTFASGLLTATRKPWRAWKQDRIRRLRKMAKLMDELSPRTELLELWVDEVTDMANEMRGLVGNVEYANNPRAKANAEQALHDAQVKVHMTAEEMQKLVRIMRNRQKAYQRVRRDLAEANLRLVVSIAKKLSQSRPAVLGFDSRREPRLDASGR